MVFIFCSILVGIRLRVTPSIIKNKILPPSNAGIGKKLNKANQIATIATNIKKLPTP